MKRRFSITILFVITFIIIVILIPSIVLYKDIRKNQTKEKNMEEEEEIEIKFISSWAGTDTKSNGLKTIIEEFEQANPGIKIINKSMAGGEFLFSLKTDFAQGNDPDVFGLWPGSDINILIGANKVADLTDILNEDEKWKSSFGEKTWQYDEVNGRIYGIPCEIIYEGLFINKDLFEKYNVNIPETYEELVQAVNIFKDNNIIPIAYNCTAEGTYLYQNIVAKLGGKINTEIPYENGKVKLCYIEAMDYVKQLYELGAFPKDAFTLDNRARDNLFINKEAAMIVQGSWFIGDGALDGNDNSIEIVPFPSFSEGKSDKTSLIYGLGNGNFHISEKAFKDMDKREACIKFLKFLTSVNSAKTLSATSGFISNIKISEDENNTSTLNAKGMTLVENSKELIGPTDSFVDRNTWEQILVPNFPKMLEGKITPEELCRLTFEE